MSPRSLKTTIPPLFTVCAMILTTPAGGIPEFASAVLPGQGEVGCHFLPRLGDSPSRVEDIVQPSASQTAESQEPELVPASTKWGPSVDPTG
ncbi:MAG: hypothetical protein GY835_08915 [bacterium]|nr:hypothetical protein [bacterium]